MLFKQLAVRGHNRRLAEKIKKEIITSFKQKGINVFDVRLDLDSGDLSIAMYMDKTTQLFHSSHISF